MVSWKKILPVIGIGIFIYLLVKLDVRKVLGEISHMNLFYLVFIIPLVGIFICMQTLKWYVIARKQKINVPFFTAVKINLISNFYGFITPSKLGSVIRADYLKKYSDDKIGKGLSNFVLDKVLDLGSLFFLGALMTFIFREEIGENAKISPIIPLILLIIIVACTLFFLKKERAKMILGFVYAKLLPEKIREKAKITFHSFYEDMPNKRFLLSVALLNLVAWISIISVSYVIGLSIGINISFFYYLVIMPICTIVAQIPISISGLGIREGTMIILFGIFNVPAIKVFSLGVIDIFFMLLIPSSIGLLLAFLEKSNKQEASTTKIINPV